MSQQKAIDILNQVAVDLGLSPTRRRSSFIWWRGPKNWKGTKYLFAYTPWKTRDGDKVGFFALKYREFKNGKTKLVKSVRFGKRKTAKHRSLKWHCEYYGV